MKSTLIIILISSFFHLNAQSFLILKNGEKVEYKKYKIKDKDHIVEIKKPKPAIVKISEIDLLVNDAGEIRYIKERVNDVSALSGDWHAAMDPDYTVMEKELDGKISIFSYIVSHNYGQYGGQQTVTYYFLEKGELFTQIFNSDLLESKKKNNKEAFNEYFSDDEEILNKLNAEDFKANGKNIYNLIREYNIKAIDEESSTFDGEQCGIILFRGYSSQAKGLVAEIDVAGQHITLENMNYQRVKLPDDQPVKICVSNGKTEHCDIISSSKHVLKTIEIQLKLNGEIDIETKNKKQYQRYINILRDSY